MILILGKNGYISKRFQKFFDYKGIAYEAASIRPKNYPYNYRKHKLIINCTGYTGKPNVDACEDNKEETLYVNAILGEHIAEVSKKLDIPMIHVSSGCIYESDYFIPSIGPAFKKTLWGTPFDEEYEPNFSFKQKNCSWYSGTKALGETLVRKTWDKHYICRLRMPFNHIDEDKNYISKLLKYPKVWSIPNSLTNVDEFVQSCYNLYNYGAEYGTYNMTNPGPIDAEDVLNLAAEYGIKKDTYEYFESQEEFDKVIKTPRSNCVLNTDKLEKAGCGMLPVRESLKKCFESWNKKENIIFW